MERVMSHDVRFVELFDLNDAFAHDSNGLLVC
jgi:hypothetical protein